MSEIKLTLDEKGRGAFSIMDGSEQMGEMVVSIQGSQLTAHHTEVSPRAGGKGYGKMLLMHMVEYVRKNHLKVIPRCPFVHGQFKRHPEMYADVWKKN